MAVLVAGAPVARFPRSNSLLRHSPERAQRVEGHQPSLAHAELRLSQETLAETLGISQPQVSKIEHRTDLYLSTLRRYIEAMNGKLEVVARFAEGVVRITQFQAIEPEEPSGAIRRVILRELPEELSEGWRADQSPSWAAGEVSGGKGMSKGLTPKIVPGGRCAA